MMKTYKIVIAEPSVIIRNGLEKMILDLPDYETVAQSGDLQSLSARLRIICPDVLIVNPQLFDFSKRKVIRSLFEDIPNTKIVALVSSYFDSQMLRQFHGVLEINDDLQRIKFTLNQVVAQNNPEESDADSVLLSDREKEVLVCLAKGRRNNEIADSLKISVHTVITHRKNIVRKTGIKSVAALTVYAILNNLIEEKDII